MATQYRSTPANLCRGANTHYKTEVWELVRERRVTEHT